MRGTSRWGALGAAGFALVGLAACVDLFHSTDAVTLCDIDSDGPGCTPRPPEAGADTAAPPSEDAGTDAPAPPVDICTTTTAAARARAVEACAALSTCELGLGESSYGACFRAAMQAYDCTSFPNRKLVAGSARHTYWACLAGAKTCSAVRACVYPDEAQPLCPGGGSVATACGSKLKARTSCPVETVARSPGESCAGQGRTCAKVDEFTTRCVGSAGVGCAIGQGCSGTALTRCVTLGFDASIDLGYSCADIGGKRCTDDTDGPACVPDGTSCTGKGATCAAGKATACIGGKLETLSCAALDAVCADSPGFNDPLDLCQAASTCPEVDERCEGATVTTCTAGVTYRLPCTGRGQCKTTTIDGVVRAYCTELKP